MNTVQQLFDRDIKREIREVIKVDQNDAVVLLNEIEEYVVTDAIQHSFGSVLDAYAEVPNKPSDRMAVWVSGFFGSGKSSFAKLFGAAIENRNLNGQSASDLVAARIGDPKVQVLLRKIRDRMPTEVVIFDLATDTGVRNANQKLTEIIYRQLLEQLGYARDLDLAQLEINLEDDGRLDQFKQAFEKSIGKPWDSEKAKIAFAMSYASRVLHEIDPKTYPAADSWVKAARGRTDISPNDLAERCIHLLDRRRGQKQLVFVIDEVGQFVARDVAKMLDLQGIVQAMGRVGQGRVWIVVTSQEKLNEMVGSLDDKRVELARLMDRFPDNLRVHLEASDIATVTSRRVLAKKADAQKLLRDLFEKNRGRLTAHAQPQADINLPMLTAESFINLYPLLPYQIDLIISIVSGLRTQGGAISHVGGANRTVIKLAQQLLTNPQVGLAERPVGRLVTLDIVFDLVRGNISSEIRDKIDHIPSQVDHRLAPAVAKAICLLQFVPQYKRTAETIAAVLHPAIDADSVLVEVQGALTELEARHLIRKGDDGYRIPSPTEDDWEKQRASLSPKSGEIAQIIGDQIHRLWEPQPTHELQGTRIFRAGLKLNGRERMSGDLNFEIQTHPRDREWDAWLSVARRASQLDPKSIFWLVPITDRIDRVASEIYRSQEMCNRKQRGAATQAELNLLGEERRRLQSLTDDLRRLVKEAFLTGVIYFRGNDRSPSQSDTEIARVAENRMGEALPEVFERFKDAAAKVQKKDIDAVLTSENLQGLPPVFINLGVVKTERGRGVFCTDKPPLSDVYAKIDSVTSYGNPASGKLLENEFGKEPYGWDFEVIKLLTLCLLRAGKIIATSKGRNVESAQSDEARELFTNNPAFRAASFRPKKALDPNELVTAAENFKTAFGKDIPELSQEATCTAIRQSIDDNEDAVAEARSLLRENGLPGESVLAEALSQMKAIRSGTQEATIQLFNTAHAQIREAIQRAAALRQRLTDPQLVMLRNARTAAGPMLAFLQQEPDTDDGLKQKASALADLLQRETFFQELPAIDQNASAIRQAYEAKFALAVEGRVKAYGGAVATLQGVPGWSSLKPEQQERIAQPLTSRVGNTVDSATPITQIRSDTDACPKRLADAIRQVNELIEGERLVTLSTTKYFSQAIETPEQLSSTLDSLRQDCEHQLGLGKKILIQ